MAEFLGNVNSALCKPTAERLYCNRLRGIVESLPSDVILVGDKMTSIELYFIDWVKSFSETQELSYKNGAFISQLFHEIALGYPPAIDQPAFDALWQGVVDLYKYEAMKFNFINVGADTDANHLWNSRLSNLYILVKDITGTGISEHCQDCAHMVKHLESSFNHNMLVLLSFLSNHTLLEEFYAHLFENLLSPYWNIDVMAAAFKTCICKHLVLRHFHSLDRHKDVFNGSNFTFLLLWATQPSLHVYVKMPFAPLVQRILTRLQVDIYNFNLDQSSNGGDRKPNETSCNYKCAFPLVLRSLEHMTAYMENKYISKSPKTGVFYKCGYKQMHRTCLEAHIVLRFLLEQLSYIEQMMLEMDTSYAMQQQHAFGTEKSPLDIRWLYNALVFADFEDFGSANLHKCRFVVLTMYAIALYHQRSYMRVDDLTYLPMLHALPWTPAIDFVSQDVVLHYISASFIKAAVQCLGDGHLINVLGNETLQHLFVKAMSHDLCCIGTNPLKCNLFPQSNAFFNAKIVHNILSLGKMRTVAVLTGFANDLMLADCKIRYSSTWHALTSFIEATSAFVEDASLEDTINTSTSIENNWLLYYLVSMCRENPSICCRTLLEFLIIKYIMTDDDFAKGTNFNRDTMILFQNESSSNVYIALKDIMDSNYIALHQNPINLLLRVPKWHLLKLLQLRFFYNILLQLLDKMSKYIYIGCANLLLNGDAQVYQTCALQQIGMINIILHVAACYPSPQVLRNLKGFVSSILHENGFATQMLLSVGVPLDCDYDLLQCCCSCLTFSNAVACYENAIKALVGDNDYKRCWSKDDILISTQEHEIQRTLEPMDATDFIAFSLYLVLVTCEIKQPGESTQADGSCDWNTCINAIVSSFYECVEKLQPSPLAASLVDKGLNVLVKLHYLYPSIGNISSVFIKEFLKSGCQGIDAISSRLKNARKVLDVIFEQNAAKA